MDFDRSRQPMDVPPPPTADEIAARMGVPLLTLVDQDTVEEAGMGHQAQHQGDTLLVETAGLSYTLWRYPADRSDPRNLRELSPQERAGLEMEPVEPLPGWILEARDRMQYPMLWESVRTTHFPGGGSRSVDDVLAEHMNHILMNVFRDERVTGGFPGELVERIDASATGSVHPVLVDGEEIEGVRVDSDPHVLGLGAVLGSRVLTVAIPREFLPHLRVEFATRPAPPG